ncbi:flagellar motor protein MotB [Zavarzinia aquatilis]|uniref:Chemotaxis protein MotB n=1 Tax=Zavarzinia aquatilis TaxID=2211142 RepID=A0A317EFD5_9PROT|nr:flagellar motor protein MotB [Zavarzinia aquatilis]PWR25707.1 chemotaxis protein MotB [Zavarzinia aquatilis]
MATDNQPTIIIKRVKKVAGGHHGGAWKVAYADFVTAMMAFFLLLWLLNATSEAQKQGIADYFDPVSVSETTSGAGGVMGGQTIAQDGNRNSGGVTALITRIEPDSQTSDQEENDDSQPVSGLAQQDNADHSHQPAAGGPASSAIDAPAPGDANARTENPRPADALGQQTPPPGVTAADADMAARNAALARAEAQRFADTATQLRQALQEQPELQAIASQVLLEVTREGLRIQLVDGQSKAMFQSGSSRMSDEMVILLRKIAGIIGRLPNRIAIAGHTDSAPYRSTTGYTNWELSADRANSSRRVLTEAGVAPSRIFQVSGRAASEPLNPDNPLDPANRRITITLLRESPVLPPGIATVPSEP